MTGTILKLATLVSLNTMMSLLECPNPSEDDAEMQQQAQDDGRIFIIADKWGRDTLHIVNYQDLPHLLLEEVASLLKCGSGAAILRLTKGHLGKYVIDQQVQLLPLRTLGVVLSLIRNQHVDKLRSDLMRHLMHTINSFNHNDPCWFRQP
ncbi:hypothetical protein B566_EDAN015511 [Ephemera danica]|nr:hypothetical protein B566_EDAN015511 [Ephemera danica]